MRTRNRCDASGWCLAVPRGFVIVDTERVASMLGRESADLKLSLRGA
jgi:hypothetical protein